MRTPFHGVKVPGGLARVLMVSVAFIAAGVSLAAAEREGKVDALAVRMFRHDEARFLRTWTPRFQEVLGIRRGMTILDIGTGAGRYAVRFAELLGGTGSVFATDIVPRLVENLAAEAERRGLENLHPVLVAPGGVDEFYGMHTYDLITLFHASLIHLGKIAYFREIKSYLSPGGRLVVTYEVLFPPFTGADIVDPSGLARELAAEPEGSPFAPVLGGRARVMLEGEAPEDVLREALAEDLNAVVNDLMFGSAFAEGMRVKAEAAFTPEEREFADWLLLYVRSNGLWDGASPDTFGVRRNAMLLNRLLLVQRYRRFLVSGVAAPYGHGGQGEAIRNRLEEAGFQLEKIWDDIVPFEITLVFTRGE